MIWCHNSTCPPGNTHIISFSQFWINHFLGRTTHNATQSRQIQKICNLNFWIYIRSRNSWLITVRKSQFGWSWHQDKHWSCTNGSTGNDPAGQSDRSKCCLWPMRWLCTAPEAEPGPGCWHCTLGEQESLKSLHEFSVVPSLNWWCDPSCCEHLTPEKRGISSTFQDDRKTPGGKLEYNLTDHLRPECTETSFLRPGLAGQPLHWGEPKAFCLQTESGEWWGDHSAASIMTLSIQVTWKIIRKLAFTPPTPSDSFCFGLRSHFIDIPDLIEVLPPSDN